MTRFEVQELYRRRANQFIDFIIYCFYLVTLPISIPAVTVLWLHNDYDTIHNQDHIAVKCLHWLFPDEENK